MPETNAVSAPRPLEDLIAEGMRTKREASAVRRRAQEAELFEANPELEREMARAAEDAEYARAFAVAHKEDWALDLYLDRREAAIAEGLFTPSTAGDIDS